LFGKTINSSIRKGPLMALNGHSATAVESLLLGAKRTLANRCAPTSIYRCTA
jgi:hypothetical protein